MCLLAWWHCDILESRQSPIGYMKHEKSCGIAAASVPAPCAADAQHEISRDGNAPWLFLFPLLLGLPGVLWTLSRGDYGIATAVFVFTLLLVKGTWNVVRYERDTPLMRIEGGSLTWFGDIPKHRFAVAIADIHSWQIEYFGMRKHPFYQMTVRTHDGATIQQVFSAIAISKSAEVYPLLQRYLGHRFTPPFQEPAL